ncbi:hypothetical protein LSTR_LSTR002700 [Laodelphax striatellus]|uniref:Sorting nexin-13 n=1 Tax=Laodelphax striatellus TaxID=195883 RepID=A0A482X6F2_LAOST|nr:hypothetical protein LSTR_LSTR002700 [Laodelphax striatellus]
MWQYFEINSMPGWVSSIAWIGLTAGLFASSFGLIVCISSVVSIALCVLGGITLVYLNHGEAIVDYLSKADDTCELQPPGLYKVLEVLQEGTKKKKTDNRLTGSQVIDEQLHEILEFTIRDYVYPWYDEVSADDDFPHEIRVAAHKLIVAFASRMKEVDWIPYLTTRLVDDAASHLRLFRQARARMKQGTNGTGEHRRQASGDHRWINSNSNGAKTEAKSPVDLECAFFDLELTMEENLICRDHVCFDSENEINFVREICEVVLFLMLPEENFHCKSLRYFVRELLVNSILMPLIEMFSDPDYINQIIIWLCRDIPITSEVFLTALRVNDNLDELHATKELLSKEVATLVSDEISITRFQSRDSGGDDDTWVKQQLGSLVFVVLSNASHSSRLQEGLDNDSAGLPSHIDYSKLLMPGVKLFSLPLDVLLKNNVALSFFIDYMTSIGAQAYLFFYLNVEGWRVSAEQQLSDLALQKMKAEDSIERGVDASVVDDVNNDEQTLERMREAAYSIFEQYLSDKASPRLRIDELIVKKLLLRIRTETPHETWFDDVQAAVYEKLQTEERFLNSFRKNVLYVKLLAELELLKDHEAGCKSDEEDTGSLEDNSLGSETASLSSLTLEPTKDGQIPGEFLSILPTGNLSHPPSPSHGPAENKQGPFILLAEIIETGVVNEKGKTFGIYALAVTKKYDSGFKESWHIYRRYSDFYELYQKVREKYTDLSKLAFPGKKTFQNMERKVLERRMRMLNDYLPALLQTTVLASHPSLRGMLLSFFEPGEYDKGVTGGQITKAFDTLLNPLRVVSQGVKAVKTMPDNLLSTVDGMMDGISKVLQYSGVNRLSREDSSDCEAIKVGASIDVETDDNIPLRIMLLLMTEVFELKSRNQWLRRRIVTLLRQIIRTMFGDIVNRRILDYVFLMTSPHQVADYLRSFKHSYWPHGMKPEPRLPRDDGVQARTRVAAKVALLSSLSDEIKHILGSETSRRGLLSVFSLLQNRVLNRRLVFVLFEGILVTMFSQDHPLDTIFRRLHSKSPRVSKSLLQPHRR